jgi:cysteine desulfurase/selenocysteine lyase
VDLQALGCDFYVFSGHKLYGPTGVGALVGTREALETLPPWQGGGDMISSVTYESAEYNSLPWRLEAGTPHIAGVIGLGAAVEFLDGLPLDELMAHEDLLLETACAALDGIPGVRRVGLAPQRVSVLSFVVDGAHPSDVATLLDLDGIAVRSGHHCAQPLLERLGLNGTVRASFSLYNTLDEVEHLAAALRKALRLLGLS